jgi:murein DD-endopeptidase MepM/ murein hydrolase activator NlpD
MSLRSMLAALLLTVLAPAPALTQEFRLPADCRLGVDCFFQQFPDMKAGDGTLDPFCGIATYEGHDGVDLRILSMKDIERGVAVVAVADGRVLRGRDGVADRLIVTEAERKAIMPKACGNGVVVSHGNGVETQYCHLRKGSIVVKAGQTLKAGDKIGEIGASGLVQFPHVHLTVRVRGSEVDPLTGRKVGDGCVAKPSEAKPLFAPDIMAAIRPGEPTILGLGIAGEAFEYHDLVTKGVPASIDGRDQAQVAWAWLANMSAGDRLKISLTGPDGQRLLQRTMEALDKSKAVYFGYSGKRGSPKPGTYWLEISVIRDGKPVVARVEEIEVE